MKRLYFIYSFGVFLIYAAQGTFAPIAVTYLSDIGISVNGITMILSAAPIFIMILMPTTGRIADRTGKIGTICEIELVAAALCAAIFAFARSPAMLFFTYGINIGLVQSVFALMDIVMLRTRFRYNSLRIWGSLGFAVAAQIAGMLYDRFSHLAVYTINILVLTAAAMLVRTIRKYDSASAEKRACTERVQSIGKIAENRTYRKIVLFSFLIMGMFLSQETFSPMLFRVQGGTAAQIGQFQLLLTLFEVPVILGANLIFKRVSWMQLTAFCALFSAGTYWWYATLPEPRLLIAAFFTKGFSFTLFMVAMTKATKDAVDEKSISTAMSIQNMAAKGVGALVVNLIGGKIIEVLSICPFYQALATASIFTFLLAIFFLARKRCSDKQILKQHSINEKVKDNVSQDDEGAGRIRQA